MRTIGRKLFRQIEAARLESFTLTPFLIRQGSPDFPEQI